MNVMCTGALCCIYDLEPCGAGNDLTRTILTVHANEMSKISQDVITWLCMSYVVPYDGHSWSLERRPQNLHDETRGFAHPFLNVIFRRFSTLGDSRVSTASCFPSSHESVGVWAVNKTIHQHHFIKT